MKPPLTKFTNYETSFCRNIASINERFFYIRKAGNLKKAPVPVRFCSLCARLVQCLFITFILHIFICGLVFIYNFSSVSWRVNLTKLIRWERALDLTWMMKTSNIWFKSTKRSFYEWTKGVGYYAGGAQWWKNKKIKIE